MTIVGQKNGQTGFTLIEMLVTIFVFTVIFGGLLFAVQSTLKLISNTKATTSATSLANERLEYFRSLPYANVGTVGGIPNGASDANDAGILNRNLC